MDLNLTRVDVEFLAAMTDPAARRALADLPIEPPVGPASGIGPSAEGGPSGSPVPDDPEALDAGESIQARLFVDEDLPDAVRNALGRLPDGVAAGVLTALIERLGAAAAESPGNRERLHTGTKQLRRITLAMQADGRRAVAAFLPDPRIVDVVRAHDEWVDGLLHLVHPRHVLALVRSFLMRGPSPAAQRSALMLLAGVAPRLGRAGPTHVVDPGGRGRKDLVRLVRLTRPESVADGGQRAGTEPPRLERTVYPKLDQLEPAVAGEPFRMEVGLTGLHAHAAGPGMPAPAGAFVLQMFVHAVGGEVQGSGEVTVEVTPNRQFPSDEVVILAAVDATECLVTVDYRIDGRSIGDAVRMVRIDGPLSARPAVDVPFPPLDGVSPDVEVVVLRGAGDELVWTFHRRGTGAVTSRTRLPAGAAADVTQELDRIEARARRGSEHMRGYLHHVSLLVADTVPVELWTQLWRVWEQTRRTPSLLIRSQFGLIPWELARVPSPWLRGHSPLLGAQARVGTWPVAHDPALAQPAPPTELTLGEMAVVRAVALPGDRNGYADFGAVPVANAWRDIRDCLTESSVDVVVVDTHGDLGGIILDDGGRFHPGDVTGCEKSAVRLAVLHGCQLARHTGDLGSTVGMPKSFVQIGAGVVIAPLWRLRDGAARRVGTEFRQHILQPSEPMAEFLRSRRTARLGGADIDRLAYVHVGHPELRIRWKPPTTRPEAATA